MRYYDVTVEVSFEEGCMVFNHTAGFKEDVLDGCHPQWVGEVEDSFINPLKRKYDRDFPNNLYVSVDFEETDYAPLA